MKRQTLVAILLAMSLATSAALAQNGPLRFQVPDDMKLCYYARISGTPQEIYHNDEWAAIVFYYEPAAVPSYFNLLDFYTGDPPSGTMTVAGFMMYDPDTLAAGGPFSFLNIHGLGAVPIWFVQWPELQAAISDKVLTMLELGAQSSLQRGTAVMYQEVFHPLKNITINAQGLLEDGRSFDFYAMVSAFSQPNCCYGPKVKIKLW